MRTISLPYQGLLPAVRCAFGLAMLVGVVLASGCAEQGEVEVSETSPVPDTATASVDAGGASGADAVSWSYEEDVTLGYVPFEGRWERETGELVFTFDEEPSVRVNGDLATRGQALWCRDQLLIAVDGNPDTNPPETAQLRSFDVLEDSACGLAYGGLGGYTALCSDVELRSFYTSRSFTNVYAEVREIPESFKAYTYADRIAAQLAGISGVGTGALPPAGEIGRTGVSDAPTDSLGGLFSYGDLAPGAATTRQWVFRNPPGQDSFTFRGRVVVQMLEVCDGIDNDCDGYVDEGLGCLNIGAECRDNSDCQAGVSCIYNEVNDNNTCGGGLAPEDCSGTVDTNGDGNVGCQDPTCSGVGACPVFSCARGNLGSATSNVSLAPLATFLHRSTGTSDQTLAVGEAACGSQLPGVDTVYRWQAPYAGDYTITTAGSTFDTALVVVPAVCPIDVSAAFSPGGPGQCADSAAAGETTEELTLTNLNAGDAFFIIVDSRFPPATPVVGNGTGSLSIYRVPVCGDNVLDANDRLGNVLEECDSGAVNTTTCNFDCSFTRCGDGYVNLTVENCEDGNLLADDGCSPLCQSETGWDCNPTGCTERCGDGIVPPGGSHVCDDGNLIAVDGCNATCTAVATGWTCPAGGGACAEVCGDGLVVGSEVCDSPSAPGCDNSCRTVRNGFRCPSAGGVGGSCTPINECAEGTAVCGADASCVDLTPDLLTVVDTYRCDCNAGYTGDGQVCTNINECLTGTVCGPNTNCQDLVPAASAGSRFACSCQTGFSGDAFDTIAGCTDVDECATANGGCDTLTTCTNTAGSRTCGACPSGYTGSGDLGCERGDCGAPVVPANATVSTTPADYRLNSTVVYACQSGYELTGGNLSRTCEPSGGGVAFSGTAPVCSAISCGLPSSPPANATRVGTATSYVYPQVAQFTCNAGWTIADPANLDMACGASGSFSAPAGACERVACPTIATTDVANGTVSAGDNLFETERTITCNTGYARNGASAITCQDNGQWSSPLPTCEIKSCVLPTTPPNMTLATVNPSNLWNTSVNYSCNPGYTQVGSLTSTCEDTGPSTAAYSALTGSCQIQSCGTLSLPNGSVGVLAGDGASFGSRVSFTCNAASGYVLSGSAVRECVVSGASVAWNGTASSCALYDCGAPELPTNNGRLVSQSGGTTFGASVTLGCEPGYGVVSGDTTRTCGIGGWSGTLPVCAPLACPSVASGGPAFVANATIVSGDPAGLFGGPAVTWACNEGYRLTAGDVTRSCEVSGGGVAWTGTTPVCTRISCAPLNGGALANGQVLSPAGTLPATLDYNQTIQYGCNNGFDPVGSFELRCTGATDAGGNIVNNGWNNPLPTCEAGSCGELPVVANSTRVWNGSTAVNVGSVTYTCVNPGYNLTSGNLSRQCLPTGVGAERQWTGTSPVCTPVTCPSLSTPTGQLATGDTTNFDFGALRTFECNPAIGYVLPSGATQADLNVSCNASGDNSTGVWSTPAAACERVTCPVLPAPGNGGSWSRTSGDVSGGGAPFFGAVYDVSCPAGYVIQGEASRTCGLSGWSGNPTATTCVPASCGTAGPSVLSPAGVGPSPSIVTAGGAPSTGLTGDRAVYSCPAGWEFSGGAATYERTCTANAGTDTSSWSGTPATCVRRTCSALTAPANGALSSADRAYETTVNFSCNTGYRRNGAASATCQLNGGGPGVTWSANVPTCERITCDPSTQPAVVTGRTPPALWPNPAVVATSTPGSASTVTHTCAGGYSVQSGAGGQVCQTSDNITGAWAWSSGELVCAERSCSATPPTRATFVAPSGPAGDSTLGGQYTYTCQSGYYLTSSSASGNTRVSTCSYNAGTDTMEWSATAACVPVSCGAFTASAPSNTTGGVSYNTDGQGSQRLGSTARWNCATGFDANGDTAGGATVALATCGATGTWSVTQTCQPVSCPATLPTVANTTGAPTGSGFAPTNTRVWTCSDGFVNTGNTARTVTATCAGAATGTWNVVGSCSQVTCGSLTPTGNQSTTPNTTQNWGATAVLGCNSGWWTGAGGNLTVYCGYGGALNTTTGSWRITNTSGSTTFTRPACTTAQVCQDMGDNAAQWDAAVVYSAGTANNRPVSSTGTERCLAGTTEGTTGTTVHTCTAAAGTNQFANWVTTAPSTFTRRTCTNATAPATACRQAYGAQSVDHTVLQRDPPLLFACECATGYSSSTTLSNDAAPTTCQPVCGNNTTLVDAPQIGEACDYGSSCNTVDPPSVCPNKCEGVACDTRSVCRPNATSGICEIPAGVRPNRRCDDGEDNDGDGLVDCFDPDCSGVGECPAWAGSCGIDAYIGSGQSGLGALQPAWFGWRAQFTSGEQYNVTNTNADYAVLWRAPHTGTWEFNTCQLATGVGISVRGGARIPDSAFSASGSYSTSFGLPRRARLWNLAGSGNGGWAASSGNNWLQVDLGASLSVGAIGTQGHANYSEWMTSYWLLYSTDNVTWRNARTNAVVTISAAKDSTYGGNAADYFAGNTNNSAIVYNSFAPRTGRYWRIQSRTFNGYPSLRMELYRSDSDVFTGHDSTAGVYSGLQCATGNAPGVGNVRDSFACPDCYCGAIQFNAARGELFTLVAGRDEANSTVTAAPLSIVPVGFSAVCGDGVVDSPQAFGVANGRITDGQLTANLQNDAGPNTARLNRNINENTSGAGWHLDPSRAPGFGGHFIQTDFLVPMEVGAIATQGRRHNTWSDWVTSFRVEYRTTASGTWTAVTNPATGTTTFTGNYDKDSVVINRWTPVTARYWRVVPLTTFNWIGLRLEWFPEYEECDDGNTTNGDGCSSSCGIERGATACMIDSSVQGAESSNQSAFYGYGPQNRGTQVSNNCPPGTYATGFRAAWVSPVVTRFGARCAPLVASATGTPRTISRGTVAESSSTVYGSTTGTLTNYDCPADQFMMGISIAYGDAIDRLQAICGTWAYDPSSVTLSRTRNTSAVYGPGGTGGPNAQEYLCPANQIVTGFDLRHSTPAVGGWFIHNVRVTCGPALPTSPLYGTPTPSHFYFDAACRGTSLSTSHVAVGLNTTVSSSNATRIQPTCGRVANLHNTSTNPYSYRLTRGRASTAANQGASVVTGTAVGTGTLATAGTCPAGSFMTGVSYASTGNTNLRPRCRSFSHNGTSLVAGTVSNATTGLAQTYDCPGNGIVTRIITRSSNSTSAPSQVAVECGQVNAFCDNDSYITIINIAGQSAVIAPNVTVTANAPLTNCREVADVEIDAEWSTLTASSVLDVLLENSSSGGFWFVSDNATFSNPVGWYRNYAYQDFYDLDLWDWARGTWTLYLQNTSASSTAGILRDLRVRVRCLNP